VGLLLGVRAEAPFVPPCTDFTAYFFAGDFPSSGDDFS